MKASILFYWETGVGSSPGFNYEQIMLLALTSVVVAFLVNTLYFNIELQYPLFLFLVQDK